MFFWDQFTQKRGHYGPRTKWKTIFVAEITKVDHQLSETFCFIDISHVLTKLRIFFYLEWCLLSKKCHFQLKQLCSLSSKWWFSQVKQASQPINICTIISSPVPPLINKNICRWIEIVCAGHHSLDSQNKAL